MLTCVCKICKGSWSENLPNVVEWINHGAGDLCETTVTPRLAGERVMILQIMYLKQLSIKTDRAADVHEVTAIPGSGGREMQVVYM